MNKSFEGPVDALINWRFSMRITRVLARRSLAITPNHVTMLSILVGITASLLILQRSYAMLALGGVLLEVQSILDSVDGELARLRFQYSKLGQWLDNLSDDVVDNLFIISAGYLVGGAWLWVAIAAAAARLLNNRRPVPRHLPAHRHRRCVRVPLLVREGDRVGRRAVQAGGSVDVAALARPPRHLRVHVDARVRLQLPLLGRRARRGDRGDRDRAARRALRDQGVAAS